MTTNGRRRTSSAFLAVLLAVSLAACSGGGSGGAKAGGSNDTSASSGGSGAKGSGGKTDDAKTDALPDPKIELADDVVVIRRTKGETVTAPGNDGASILLDGSNADVKKLEVGSVMLLTGVGAGRVTQLDELDGDIAVSYSSVSLPEVIENGELDWDETAVDFADGVVNVSEDMEEVSGSAVEPVGYRMRGDSVKVEAGDFSTSFDWSPSDDGGGKLKVELVPAKKFAGKITMDVDLKPVTIGGGTKVVAGKVDFFDLDFKNLQGTAKITTELQSLEQTAALHLPPFFKLPVSVSVPVPIAGIPFTLTFGVTIQVDMSFSHPNGTIKGEADFDFGGPTKFAYRGSKVTIGEGQRTANAQDTVKKLSGGGGTVGLNLTAELPKIGFGLKILQTGAGVFVSNGMVNSLTILPAPVLCHRVQVASVVAGGIDGSFLGASVTFTRKAFLDKRWTFAVPKNDKRCDGE